MADTITLTCYSDVLCIWAHIAQARLDEIARRFPDEVRIEHRFCSVFGDTADKIGVGWASRGAWEGFARHVEDAAAGHDHVQVHADLWRSVRPLSSTPAHLVLKAVQMIAPGRDLDLLRALRSACFEQALDIGRWSVLQEILTGMEYPAGTIREVMDSGAAFAALEADQRQRTQHAVQGSPTLLLDDGRQKLYGNVGYNVIEANINELLRSPSTGAASWC